MANARTVLTLPIASSATAVALETWSNSNHYKQYQHLTISVKFEAGHGSKQSTILDV